MSLSIVGAPQRIDCNANFNVTTSLVEDASHVNLRVRADIYHEGVIKATIELPKGLADFNLKEILKPLVPGILLARNTGDYYNCGTKGSQLITSFASHSGTWTTLTTSGNQIASAICTVASEIETNEITVAVGELYLLASIDFITTGAFIPDIYLHTGGAVGEAIQLNKSFLLMPTSSGAMKIILGGKATENFSGTFLLYKITTNRTTVGSPLAPYFVTFTEVYESAVGVTTTGTPVSSCLYRYVPTSDFITSFVEYVLHDSSALFANMTFRNNVVKFYTNTANECFLMFFTEYYSLEITYSKDGGANNSDQHPLCYEGWGVIIFNTGELMASVVTTLILYIRAIDLTGYVISEVITVYASTKCNTNRAVLEFDGLTGGKEYLAFEGKKQGEFTTIREYFTNSRKIKSPLNLNGVGKYILETLYTDSGASDYLAILLLSKDVKLLIGETIEPIAVTVINESGVLTSDELFANQIEIEFDYGY